MPIVKYIPIHKSPLRLLQYMTREGKTEDTLVSGIYCSDNMEKAYKEMKWYFEYHSGERFYKKSLNNQTAIPKKESIRLHHYIQSFKPGEVTPEEAHEIAREWARETFGSGRPIFISTHIDKGHIHNHIAVSAFDTDGKRWLANKESLKRARELSDKIAKRHRLSVIENPKYKPNHNYGEHLARKFGQSWKQKLCDTIDEIILKPNVHSIDDLVNELKAEGYGIRRGKYLAIKVKSNRRAIRSYRLGDGYSLEHLLFRIEHKNMEMPLSEAYKYEGLQREFAMCIRQLQIEIYRKPEKDRLHIATYREVQKTLDVLSFVSANDIHSAEDFQKKVTAAEENVNQLLEEKQKILDKLSECERAIGDIDKYLEIRNRKPLLAKDVEELAQYRYLIRAKVDEPEDKEKFISKAAKCREMLTNLDERIRNAKAEYKDVSAKYQIYTDILKTDYEILLERAKAEQEEMRRAEEQRRAEHEREEEYEDCGYYYNDDAR